MSNGKWETRNEKLKIRNEKNGKRAMRNEKRDTRNGKMGNATNLRATNFSDINDKFIYVNIQPLIKSSVKALQQNG